MKELLSLILFVASFSGYAQESYRLDSMYFFMAHSGVEFNRNQGMNFTNETPIRPDKVYFLLNGKKDTVEYNEASLSFDFKVFEKACLVVEYMGYSLFVDGFKAILCPNFSGVISLVLDSTIPMSNNIGFVHNAKGCGDRYDVVPPAHENEAFHLVSVTSYRKW